MRVEPDRARRATSGVRDEYRLRRDDVHVALQLRAEPPGSVQLAAHTHTQLFASPNPQLFLARARRTVLRLACVVGQVLAKRSQIPLRLAYAITIHKCQGMTLSKVEMSLKDVFEPGQVPAALLLVSASCVSRFSARVCRRVMVLSSPEQYCLS